MQQWTNARVLRTIGLMSGLLMMLAACDTAVPDTAGGAAAPGQQAPVSEQEAPESEQATGHTGHGGDAAAGSDTETGEGAAGEAPSAAPDGPAGDDVTAADWTPLADDEIGSVPDGAVRVAEFLADCPVSHFAADDPIVFPGQPGASHHHTFYGNTSTDAFSDLDSLLAADSNCDPAEDLSAYWTPTMFEGDTPVEPEIVTFYYLGEGVREDLIPQTQPMPQGLRMVAGNAMATGPDDASSRSRWSCLHVGDVGAGKDFVECPEGSMLESYLDFPQCWNGTDLDSADHMGHMAYPVDGECPATHPVQVPKLRQVIRYPVNGDTSDLRLASGAGSTMHGDFFNAWPQDEMARRVRDCIRPSVKCGADGTP